MFAHALLQCLAFGVVPDGVRDAKARGALVGDGERDGLGAHRLPDAARQLLRQSLKLELENAHSVHVMRVAYRESNRGPWARPRPSIEPPPRSAARALSGAAATGILLAARAGATRFLGAAAAPACASALARTPTLATATPAPGLGARATSLLLSAAAL